MNQRGAVRNALDVPVFAVDDAVCVDIRSVIGRSDSSWAIRMAVRTPVRNTVRDVVRDAVLEWEEE